jgi:hypothetical protein
MYVGQMGNPFKTEKFGQSSYYEQYHKDTVSVVGRTGRTWQMAEVVFFGCVQGSTRGSYMDVRPLDTNIESMFQVPSSFAS